MHAKAKEVQSFIDKDLISIISGAFGEVDDAKKLELKTIIYEKPIQTAKKFSNPNLEDTEPVKKAEAALDAVKETLSSGADVYNHLYRFFERYYDDFLSRRYYIPKTF